MTWQGRGPLSAVIIPVNHSFSKGKSRTKTGSSTEKLQFKSSVVVGFLFLLLLLDGSSIFRFLLEASADLVENVGCILTNSAWVTPVEVCGVSRF